MTRQEHLEKLKKDLHRARAYGDRLEANDVILAIEELEKVKDSEYESFIKLKKMYAASSVKLLSPSRYR